MDDRCIDLVHEMLSTPVDLLRERLDFVPRKTQVGTICQAVARAEEARGETAEIRAAIQKLQHHLRQMEEMVTRLAQEKSGNIETRDGDE